MRRFRYQEQFERWQLSRMYHPRFGRGREPDSFLSESGLIRLSGEDTRPQPLREIVALGYLSGEFVEASDNNGFVIWFDCESDHGYPKLPVTFVTREVVSRPEKTP